MNDDQKSKLKELLTRLVDSHEGYKEYAKKAAQERHKKLFQDYSDKRGKDLENVRLLLETGGEQVEIDTSFIADARGAWTDLVHKFDGNDDESLLEEICRLENTVVSAYKEAIAEMADQPEVLKTLQEQLREAQSAADLMDAKEEAA